MTQPTIEQFTRQVATHRATCDGALAIVERTVRPLESATLALQCATCDAVFRGHFTVAEAAGATDPAEWERLFERLLRQAIN